MSVAALVQSSAPAAHLLEVSVSVDDAATVIALGGDADAATMPILLELLARVIADQKGDVIVDLARTEFIGTPAVRALVQAKDVLANGDRHLSIRSPSRIADRLLALLGLSDLISPEPPPTR